MARYATVQMVAQMFNVTTQTVRNWVKQGTIPSYQLTPKDGDKKHGSKVFIKLEDVEKALKRGKR